MEGVDTNKVAESIYAEKTAKLHRLLGEKEEKGFRLDLESPESEKLTDSVSEKEEKEIDELEEEADSISPQLGGHIEVNNDIYAVPVKRRIKKRSELPLGWEKHEVRPGLKVFLLRPTIRRRTLSVLLSYVGHHDPTELI